MGHPTARLVARLALIATLFAAGRPLAAQTALRNAPTRPPAPAAALPTVRLAGSDYVAAVAFGAQFALKATPSNQGRSLTLKNTWHTIELEADSRECQVDGLRVFLGDPVRLHKDGFHLSRIDAERLLKPILSPGQGETRVPDLKVILLDPGHGGRDAGKTNDRLKVNEKTLTLDTAFRLKKLLEQAGYKVVLTRTDDRALASDKATDLQRRAEAAGKAGADLFLSIHYNSVAVKPEAVTGVEVFTMTPQSQFSTGDHAREDNGGGLVNPGNRQDHWNTLLGYFVHRQLLRDLGVPDRGLKRARWAVLRQVECPAILIESGYLSSDAEARKIATPAYRQNIAEAMAGGVAAYANALEGIRRQRAEAQKRKP